MMLCCFLVFVFLFGLVVPFSEAVVDKHDNCNFWASQGECDNNPAYMLENCAASCSQLTPESASSRFDSFYEVKGESDITGKSIDFNQFRGKIVYIVNVASHCGYTASNYNQFRELKQYRQQGVEIILAPCNQFGSQEPGDGTAIQRFVGEQQFEGIVLAKADVNGAKTRPLFQFLKDVSGKKKINWNFDGKFLVDQRGNVRVVTSESVNQEILRLLQEGKDL